MATTTTTTTMSSNSTTWSRPYPPINRDGIVDEHDKPFFYYGHYGIIDISTMIIFSYYLFIYLFFYYVVSY